MGEELIEAWADATAEIYNESVTGLNLTRLPVAVDQYIDLFARSEELTFNPESSPLHYFERHPHHAVSAILRTQEATDELDDEQLEALEALADFAQAWYDFDQQQEPELGVSEADDEEGW
ncbi:hypothetical protein [Glutamicibacter sp. PS]|uniref:hypothetical protein n=1 Tax=Glutamicibacter TaxID=1742989 RepID=UPI002845C86E|nr:hypothetical protein [Glutamicibacter sp. PS]MDR4534677.1 hypothetical protein [Glutamicibacter sp. PS]